MKLSYKTIPTQWGCATTTAAAAAVVVAFVAVVFDSFCNYGARVSKKLQFSLTNSDTTFNHAKIQ